MLQTNISERRDRLRERYPEWTPRTLDTFLADCASEFGERPLVLTDEQAFSYADINNQATRLANGLRSIGVEPGDRVGILMANHPEFVPLKFAIARAGAVAVPFNYLYRSEELAYVLAQSEICALVTMTEFAGLDYPAMLDSIAPGWRDGSSDALPLLRNVILHRPLDSASGSTGLRTLDDLASTDAVDLTDHDDTPRRPGDPGDILYTSGTTGAPKGVMVTHDAVLRTAYASALTRAYQDGRRILFSLPCYHMFGYVEGLLSAMFVGGAIIPRTTFSPDDYLAATERHAATDMLAVPTMTVALLEHPDRFTRDLSSLDAILSGAAPCPPWAWERVRDEFGITEITTGYGMTECGGAMTLTLPEDPIEVHSTTVGRPKLAGAAGMSDPAGDLCRYATVDPVSGQPQPAGDEGELVSQGPTHMVEFWNKPDETSQAVRGGWLHSGDLGYVGSDGYLRLTGRSKELYKSGGELVMPKEIEELIAAVDGVSQVYAIGIPDDRWGEVGCACVVLEPDTSLNADELLAVCRNELARFKVPKHVVFLDVDDLPTTPTGKVQKFQLVDQMTKRLALDSQ